MSISIYMLWLPNEVLLKLNSSSHPTVISVMFPGSNHCEYSNNIQFHKMMHVQTSLPTLEDYIAGPCNKLQLT